MARIAVPDGDRRLGDVHFPPLDQAAGFQKPLLLEEGVDGEAIEALEAGLQSLPLDWFDQDCATSILDRHRRS